MEAANCPFDLPAYSVVINFLLLLVIIHGLLDTLQNLRKLVLPLHMMYIFGDPLSPYLFLICVEGLWSLIYNAYVQGDISRCKIVCMSPSISHFLFADDSLLFCKASN